MKRYLTTPSVASRYDVTPWTIRNWVRLGIFPKPEYNAAGRPQWAVETLDRHDAGDTVAA